MIPNPSFLIIVSGGLVSVACLIINKRGFYKDDSLLNGAEFIAEVRANGGLISLKDLESLRKNTEKMVSEQSLSKETRQLRHEKMALSETGRRRRRSWVV